MLGAGENEGGGKAGESVESGEGRLEERATQEIEELLRTGLGRQRPKPGPCAPGEDYRSDR
jgi:hypothetical protein